MEELSGIVRVNLGCGATPTPGWHNYDNSISVRLARHSVISLLLNHIGLLSESQQNFIRIARINKIKWADATTRIPFPDGSVEVLYSSHVLEHLDREHECRAFLREARRVLIPGGIIRIAVPDLKKMVDQYVSDGDADAFIGRTLLTQSRPKTLMQRLKSLIIGERHHQWMYDNTSLMRLIISEGFEQATILPPGSTTMPSPGELDLYERQDESVYLEARAPRQSDSGKSGSTQQK